MTFDPAKLMSSIRQFFASDGSEQEGGRRFANVRSAEEWRGTLTPEQYRILREHGTERPGSSELLREKRAGAYCCAGCGQPLYGADAKFDSGTGWPSFTGPLDDGIETEVDRGLLLARTEVHCASCGSHLGHRFTDGAPPTDMRHCINGGALTFAPD